MSGTVEFGKRVALVTGGARGFGKAIARRLAADGHDVAVMDIVAAEETGMLVRELGRRFISVQADIGSRASIDVAAAVIEEEFGAVDVLVANAGIYPLGTFFDTSWETWRRTMDVNLDGTFHLFQRFGAGMVERGWGRVLAMITSTVYAPPPNAAAYVTSKSAIVGLVRALAREVGPSGVTANAVVPPLADTPGVAAGPQRQAGVFDIVLQQQSIKREGRVEDVVGAISFLASDDAAFVTGQCLLSDGGTHFL